MVPNLKAKYNADVAPALMKKFQYKSTMQIPTIDKIVIKTLAPTRISKKRGSNRVKASNKNKVT